MSRNEYRERQRDNDGLTSAHSLSRLGGEGKDNDTSMFGFSLGSIQSAPALAGLGLAVGDDGAERCGAATADRDWSPRVETAGLSSTRCQNIATFDNINPFDGGIKAKRSKKHPSDVRGGMLNRETGSGVGQEKEFVRAITSGPLSPSSVLASQVTWTEAGPESNEGEEEHSQLLLIKV